MGSQIGSYSSKKSQTTASPSFIVEGANYWQKFETKGLGTLLIIVLHPSRLLFGSFTWASPSLC